MAKTKVHGEYLDASVISGQTQVTAVGADSVLIFDATDNALKKALLSDVIETVADGDISTAKIADDAVTSAKLDTNIDIAGTFDVTGATVLDSTLAVAGDANFDSGTLFVDVSADKVGIGTTSPSSLLHVNGASTRVQVSDTGTSFTAQDFLSNSDAVRATIGVERSSGGGLFVGSTAYAAVFGSASSGNTEFACNNTVRMAINSSGKIGIGTTSPDTLLNLKDTGGIEVRLEADSNNSGQEDCLIRFYTDGKTQEGIVGMDNNNSSTLFSGNTENAMVFGCVSNLPVVFATNNTERMQIDSNGFTKHSNTGTYDTYSGADDSHQFVADNTGHATLWVTNTNTSYDAGMFRLESARTPSTAFDFLAATTGNLTDDQFILRGDGNAYADGSWNGGGADYAEYFEWSDGNPSNEDRRGHTVVLVENKIRKATSEDNQNNIIGVISGNPSIIGDSDIGSWKNKYKKDDYGSYVKDENGDRVINTEYDETKNYVSREDRQEWDIVGLMGKVRINKGQTVGDRWIKMKDISDTVEEWLIK